MNEVVPRADEAVRASIWDRAIDDPPSERGDMLAIGDGVIAFAGASRICGYDEITGSRLWCATAGSSPAYAKGEVAYTAADGTVRAVDAKSGIPRWRFGSAASPDTAASPERERPILRVRSTGNDFLVARINVRAGQSGPNLGEISASGHPPWVTKLTFFGGFEQPEIVAPYAVQAFSESGATLNKIQRIVRFGPHGGPTGVLFSQAWEVLDVTLPHITMGGDWTTEEVQDHFLTFDVETADLRDGRILQRFHFEPDYDANRALFEQDSSSEGMAKYPQVLRIDGDILYATLSKRLYRYRFADPNGQRPLLLASDARFIAAYHGDAYVARADGVWTLRPVSKQIRARRIAASVAPLAPLAIVGRTAYFGFEDGRIRGVDVDSGRTTFHAKACRAERIATSLHPIYILCAAPVGWHVFAFAAPGSP